MAERLTEKVLLKKLVNGYYGDIDVYQKSYIKLGMLEDIMDKYGIEDLEQYLLKMRKVDKELRDTIQQLHTIIDSIGYDRDNWQKACELACEREDDCYVYDNIHRAYEFYQQAKKEGENGN